LLVLISAAADILFMPKTKIQKKQIMEELEDLLKKQKSLALVSFSSVDSDSLFDLRDKLSKENFLLKVTKKTLLEKVLEKMNKKKFLDKLNTVKTQIALVFGFSDEKTPNKICYQFSKNQEKFKILFGFLGDEFLPEDKMIELAQLPSKPELLASLVGVLKTPLSNFHNVLFGNIKGLLNVLVQAKK
jgi:large subunit ribosomal protein L10